MLSKARKPLLNGKIYASFGMTVRAKGYEVLSVKVSKKKRCIKILFMLKESYELFNIFRKSMKLSKKIAKF